MRVAKLVPNAAVWIRKIIVIMKVAFIVTNNYCNFSAAERTRFRFYHSFYSNQSPVRNRGRSGFFSQRRAPR